MTPRQPAGGHHRLAQQRPLAGGVPLERLREGGEPRARRRRRRQRLDRRHGGARATRVSRSSRRRDRESRVRGREQPRARGRRRGLGPVPQPGHQDPLGLARGARLAAAGTADGRSRRCQADRRERCHGPDDAALPECGPLALREPRRRAAPVPRLVARGAGARPRSVRPRDRLRLDRRLVHARCAGRRSTTSARWTSSSSSTARRPTSACACTRPGWEVVHLPQMTILHQSSTTGSDERLSAQMAFARRQYMAKHFSAAHRTAGDARARPRVCASLGHAGPRPGGPPATRLRSLCACDASRARAAAVRRSVDGVHHEDRSGSRRATRPVNHVSRRQRRPARTRHDSMR